MISDKKGLIYFRNNDHPAQMKKVFLVAMVLVGLAGVVVAVYQYQKPVEKTIAEKAAYFLNAEQLFSEFVENETLANEKYLNKVVAVKGTVSEVTEGPDETVNISLNSNAGMFGISCQFSGASKEFEITAGDTVIIKGLCTGMLMDVVLTRCAIEEIQ